MLKASIVTPGPPGLDDNERVLEGIYPADEPYAVMTDAEAWRLLEAKFSLIHVFGKYYLPPQAKSVAASLVYLREDNEPVATSLAGLRKDLCAHGVPGCIAAPFREERVCLARWVRYAHVAGLADSQPVDSDNLGEPFGQFMAGWKVMCDNFHCRYSSGRYVIPTSPTGEGKEMFERTIDVVRHFARFGIQCIPDNVPNEKLSRKDRFGLDIRFATPAFNVLNTL